MTASKISQHGQKTVAGHLGELFHLAVVALRDLGAFSKLASRPILLGQSLHQILQLVIQTLPRTASSTLALYVFFKYTARLYDIESCQGNLVIRAHSYVYDYPASKVSFCKAIDSLPDIFCVFYSLSTACYLISNPLMSCQGSPRKETDLHVKRNSRESLRTARDLSLIHRQWAP
ncbi:uncharacterized protein LY79DRAFT_188728 [Colletotrichum navitas]|uniref:Uncharacterized protein n=1 Tax=Colletotrichum navitas TaxID=681940 RepID=A0AAD8PZS0_9PEZI|nr:uncharacterized protein LY79DRAFT_188728 [Colletotrichum navitas]KAK1593138.1 hypothetical protein LY79DRAFT_188728 [Colletotrichum navitas]